MTITRTRAGLAAVVAVAVAAYALDATRDGPRPEEATAATSHPAPRVIANTAFFTESASRPERFIVVRQLGTLRIGCPGGRAVAVFVATGRQSVDASVAPAGELAQARGLNPGGRLAPPPSEPGRPLHQEWFVTNYSKGTIESATITVAVKREAEGGCIGRAQATIIRRQRQDSAAVGG